MTTTTDTEGVSRRGPEGDRATSTGTTPTGRGRVNGRVDGPVTLRGVIASEWLKFRSLRSTLLVLLAAVAGMVVFGAIIAYNTRNPAGQDPEDLVASGPLQGYYLGQLLMGALGVLVVSGEYSSGMIRASLAAVPRRLPVLVAKTAVFVVVVGIAMTAATFAAFLVAQAVLSGHRPTRHAGRRQHPAGGGRHRRVPDPRRAPRQRVRVDRARARRAPSWPPSR